MNIPSGDKSDVLFKRLLFLSLLTYSILALVIQIIPYTPEVIRGGVKPPRVVKLVEIPLKKPTPLPIPAQIKEKGQRRAEEQRLKKERRQQEIERQGIEKQKRIEEEQRRSEERRRQDEERRMAEEQRRIEEEKRLAKEKNREAAMGTGILKAMKGGGRSLDKIVSNEDVNSVISAPPGKLITAHQERTQSTNRQEYVSAQKRVPKGSGGIGDVPGSLAKAQSSGLSGKRGETGIEIRHGDVDVTAGGGNLNVSKMRSQDSIKDVVASHSGGIDFIYKKALRNNPTLKGMIVMEFTISPSGDVTGGRIVSSTIKDPSFEDQILKRILSWKFLPSLDSGNTIVSYPIEFSPV
ncbi:MAG: TonB family protein [Nitrospirae bacterium]|nr:TonB family protein [Nitrospirota bacterium]